MMVAYISTRVERKNITQHLQGMYKHAIETEIGGLCWLLQCKGASMHWNVMHTNVGTCTDTNIQTYILLLNRQNIETVKPSNLQPSI